MSKEGKPFINYDLENLLIKAGEYEFKINPDGHLPEISDKILEQVDKFEQFLRTSPGEAEKIKAHRLVTKEILNLGLIEFDYVDASKKLGYGILEKLSDFLFVYHVEHGGKEGFQLWLTQLNLTMSMGSNGTKA